MNTPEERGSGFDASTYSSDFLHNGLRCLQLRLFHLHVSLLEFIFIITADFVQGRTAAVVGDCDDYRKRQKWKLGQNMAEL